MTKKVDAVKSAQDVTDVTPPTMEELQSQISDLQKQLIAAHQMINGYKDAIVRMALKG